MNISIIGTGYVGLVSGACFAEFGFHVTCVDSDYGKINKLKNGEVTIFEPGLSALVNKNTKLGRLIFTTDYYEAIKSAQVIFICVGTPPQEDGSADLQHVLNVASAIADHMDSYKVIVNKSTVPVGTGELVKQVVQNRLNDRGLSLDFDVVSNPEFLREGAAINDFMHPDRIVIGTSSDKAREIMREVYRALFLNNHPFVFTDVPTAEIIKYASNAFLATKITFINEIANLCEVVDGNVQDVAKAMGLDKRIGKFFLHAGPGYGGSCFPKDTRALSHIGKINHTELRIVDAVIEANDYQKRRMVDKINARMNGVSNKRIAILGLAFKAETDDMRESPAITIINKLLDLGAVITAYDPEAMENAKENFFGKKISYGVNEYDAIKGADAIVIITDWNQFRALDFDRIAASMRNRYFFDLRNIYNKKILEDKGFIYEGVGK